MKKILLCAAFIAVSFTSIAQVGIGTTTPDDSAVLEISSNSKGLLIPRMTIAERDLIDEPVEGLMVYVLGIDDDDAGSFMYYDGSKWKELFRGGLATPIITSDGTGNNLDENIGAGQLVYTISVNSAITGQITYFLKGMGDTKTESLGFHETNKNEVILIPDPNYEDQEKYNFRVKAVSPQGEESLWKAVSFSISPINERPVARDDAEFLFNGDETQINVIANDEDVDHGDKLILTATNYLGEGKVEFNEDNVIYTPALNFNGTETIGYTVTDGELFDQGSLEITVVHTIKSEKTEKYWMDRNLGALQVATGPRDAQSYGDLYQWGRNTDGHESRFSAKTLGPKESGEEGNNFIIVSTDIVSKDWLAPEDNSRWIASDGLSKGVHDPCPINFRLPTDTEIRAELENYPIDQDNLINTLKFTLAGRRDHDTGDTEELGYRGYYWTSTAEPEWFPRLTRGIRVQAETDPYIPVNFTAASDKWDRAFGFSVRCIKEED
jgi:hypothetical protein